LQGVCGAFRLRGCLVSGLNKTSEGLAASSTLFAGQRPWVTQLRQDGIPVPDWVAQLPIAGGYLDRWWQTSLSNPRRMASRREHGECAGVPIPEGFSAGFSILFSGLIPTPSAQRFREYSENFST
jgi:hypothetical protein